MTVSLTDLNIFGMNRFECISVVHCGDVTDFNLDCSQLCTPNVVDPLCVDVVENSDGSVLEVGFKSDISLLFNQKRLEDTLGRDGMKKFFDDMSARSSALSQLRKKISDDDLAALCKSRYLQSPCEILAWSNYLNENYQTLLESVKARSVEPAPTSEPAPTGEPAPAAE